MFERKEHTKLVGRARAIQREAANFRHTSITMNEAMEIAKNDPTSEICHIDIPIGSPIPQHHNDQSNWDACKHEQALQLADQMGFVFFVIFLVVLGIIVCSL
jgi:hypothetical protein